jgi:hypothetical protein
MPHIPSAVSQRAAVRVSSSVNLSCRRNRYPMNPAIFRLLIAIPLWMFRMRLMFMHGAMILNQDLPDIRGTKVG